ncbi:formate dehydrogenase accessory sulfurtransferase FdhD [Sinirhodobacter sp. WL0062]|uniref:Sulfur carrier protein FdhD n=1 Tax=Rhodobacter flavimaris TaxID=2907145 RepID=A0ABS8YY34_9RHOB|nr:formate dehydrogenase accessory sulfurtransferase FdhD [Sinirhodobacter sp. WL0062]MCE5974701.1 formate dehydrogenase accessory sulfurtransferase FdhD [Sinirhodobacter sp. WL0062]
MTLPRGATQIPLSGGASEVLAEEVPVALVYDGVTQAVMMATPSDLEDFVLGFALSEGLIEARSEIVRTEIVPQLRGIEARAWLAAPAGARFKERRRATTGPVGCGLCGIDSLEQALRPLPRAPRGGGARLAPGAPARALAALRAAQPLQDATHAIHAAGFWSETGGLMLLREDVGRHNALDKLAGALTHAGIAPADGALVMTSRISVDLVQKAVTLGARALIAPSAPTALAVAEARAAGLHLIARAPSTETLIDYTAPERTEEDAA